MSINKVDFDQLMNQAKVTLTGASDAGLKGAFYDVCTEFLNDSSAWTEDILVPILTTRLTYPVATAEGQIIRLIGVTDGEDNFVSALMANVGEIQLAYYPNNNATYTVRVVKNVSLPTSRDDIPLGPSWLLPLWHVGLLDGLLGKMMIQPQKSYSSEKAGPYHLKRFRDAIARARVATLRANTNGATAWRFPQSFRSSSQQGGVPSSGSSGERTF